MQLDGYRKTDPEKVAKGVERQYKVPAPYGPKGGPAKIKVRVTYAGTGNAGYQAALGEADGEKDRLQALYDHCVLEWSTDIQSGGKDLEPTRENFLGLMEVEADEIQSIMLRVVNDVFNRQLYVEEKRAASEKN